MPYSAAYIDGWFAHRSIGTEDDDDLVIRSHNPYDVLRQRYSHGQWVCGYSARLERFKGFAEAKAEAARDLRGTKHLKPRLEQIRQLMEMCDEEMVKYCSASI